MPRLLAVKFHHVQDNAATRSVPSSGKSSPQDMRRYNFFRLPTLIFRNAPKKVTLTSSAEVIADEHGIDPTGRPSLLEVLAALGFRVSGLGFRVLG